MTNTNDNDFDKINCKMWTLKIFNDWWLQMIRTLIKSTVKSVLLRYLIIEEYIRWGIWQSQQQKCGLLRFSILEDYKWWGLWQNQQQKCVLLGF